MKDTFIFFKIQAVLKKISRLKLYLPWEKWTVKEMFIFFKYELCWKSIEAEALFTKTEMNN